MSEYQKVGLATAGAAGTAASTAAKGGEKAMSTLTHGNAPIRILASAGLGVCVYANIWHLTDITKHVLHPFDQLTQLYLAISGLVCLSLEGTDLLCCIRGLRSHITQRFPFLEKTGGRGVTYFVLGSLTAAEGNAYPIIGLLQLGAGIFLMVIGVVQAIIARDAKAQLEAIAVSQAEEAIRLFPEHATSQEGNESVMHAEGLSAICQKLGKPLTGNQAAAALTMMDADSSGGITLDEFKMFWTTLGHRGVHSTVGAPP